MRNGLLLVVVAVSACSTSHVGPSPGPDAGISPDARTDTAPDARTDADPTPACEALCFRWNERPEVPFGEAAPAPEVCNLDGVDVGRCPDGFSCEAHAPLGGTPSRVCQPDHEQPHELSFLVGEPVFEEPLAVQLRFTLEGRAWPAGDPDDVTAFVRIRDLAGRGLIERTGPLGPPGTLALALAEGDYEVTVGFWSTERDAPYPQGERVGRLQVRAAGEIEIPMRGVPVDWRVAVDGTDLATVTGEELVLVRFIGAHGQRANSSRSAGEIAAGQVVLEPDTYRVEIELDGDGRFPSGLYRTMLDVDATETMRPRFDVPTVAVDGLVTVDGRALTTDAFGEVLFRSENARQVRFSVNPNSSRYAGRVIEGTYAVSLLPGSGNVALPNGAGRAYDRVEARARIDVALRTVFVRGRLTLNGEAPDIAGDELARLDFHPLGGGVPTSIVVPTAGRFEMRMYDGDYSVSVIGGDESLPRRAWQLLPAYSPAEELALDLRVERPRFELRHAGAPLPAGTEGAATVVLTPLDVSERYPTPFVFDVPREGDAIATGLLPAGTWSIGLGTDSPFRGIPSGGAVFANPYRTGDGPRVLDVQSTEITLDIAGHGGPVPDAAEGLDRGELWLFSPVGWTSVPVPATGPIHLDVSLIAGTYRIAWFCAADRGCDDNAVGTSYRVLVDNLAVR